MNKLSIINYQLSINYQLPIINRIENLKIGYSLKIVNCKLKILIFLLYILLFLVSATPISAVMKSPNYELQMPNLNFSGGNVSSTNFSLGFTGGQTDPGSYSSTGYRVLAGFWYIKTIIPFTFSVSNNTIEFGSLSSGSPTERTTTLTVSAGGAGGYQVTAEENHQLMAYSLGAIIPDTTGDDGSITESDAGSWILDTTYGFGYTLYGDGVPTAFPTAPPVGSQYKQFADISKSETPQIVMSSPKRVQKLHSATVSYKLNVNATQPGGRYQNVITYIATPSY